MASEKRKTMIEELKRRPILQKHNNKKQNLMSSLSDESYDDSDSSSLTYNKRSRFKRYTAKSNSKDRKSGTVKLLTKDEFFKNEFK